MVLGDEDSGKEGPGKILERAKARESTNTWHGAVLEFGSQWALVETHSSTPVATNVRKG